MKQTAEWKHTQQAAWLGNHLPIETFTSRSAARGQRRTDMRRLSTLSAVGAVLALGVGAEQATALSPSAMDIAPDAFVHRVQTGAEPGEKGATRGSSGAAKGERGAGPSMGAAKEAGDAPSGGDRGKGIRSGQTRGEGMQSEQGGSAKMRSGERRERSQGRTNVDIDIGREGRGYRGQGRTGVEINVDRDRGRYGYRPEGGRTRIDIDAERRRRGGRDVDMDVRRYGPSRAYRGDGLSRCEVLRQRYQACIGR